MAGEESARPMAPCLPAEHPWHSGNYALVTERFSRALPCGSLLKLRSGPNEAAIQHTFVQIIMWP